MIEPEQTGILSPHQVPLVSRLHPEHSLNGLVIQLFGFRLIIGTLTVLFPTEIIGGEEPPVPRDASGEL
ncbi:hypothetical protein CEXT_228201 [Caerostris extrusa]|uniref:Uncharacterized protein n=1 Tax=Caerostris extrusa TaxID=172846 RepID=A0AAV4V389_CAEEX|nr:hypothetical protein CEXT_228201 [Caerostris extrusa]